MRQAPFRSAMGWCNSRRPWTTAASTQFRSSSQYGPLHAVRAECGSGKRAAEKNKTWGVLRFPPLQA